MKKLSILALAIMFLMIFASESNAALRIRARIGGRARVVVRGGNRAIVVRNRGLFRQALVFGNRANVVIGGGNQAFRFRRTQQLVVGSGYNQQFVSGYNQQLVVGNYNQQLVANPGYVQRIVVNPGYSQQLVTPPACNQTQQFQITPGEAPDQAVVPPPVPTGCYGSCGGTSQALILGSRALRYRPH